MTKTRQVQALLTGLQWKGCVWFVGQRVQSGTIYGTSTGIITAIRPTPGYGPIATVHWLDFAWDKRMIGHDWLKERFVDFAIDNLITLEDNICT